MLILNHLDSNNILAKVYNLLNLIIFATSIPYIIKEISAQAVG